MFYKEASPAPIAPDSEACGINRVSQSNPNKSMKTLPFSNYLLVFFLLASTLLSSCKKESVLIETPEQSAQNKQTNPYVLLKDSLITYGSLKVNAPAGIDYRCLIRTLKN